MSQTELLPEEQLAIYDRFVRAWEDARRECRNPKDAFYAGYKAGYGHAKDDASLAGGKLPKGDR